ncbi:MAG: type II toxin-antitoxin system HicB family antitoxin [Dolichospermum sp.]
MQTLIRLKIERFIEQDQEYFVATSDDLQGLVAEGKTVQEAIEIAEDVAKVLLELENKEEKLNFVYVYLIKGLGKLIL